MISHPDNICSKTVPKGKEKNAVAIDDHLSISCSMKRILSEREKDRSCCNEE